jgi:general secretion pathway protein A
MYRSFFGLRERPFELTPNPRFLVLTDAHREALSTLEYGIATRKGITLLTGDAGTGKSTLIRAAAERQHERVHCVHLSNPALTRSEFVEMLADHFGLSAEARVSKTALLRELNALLLDRHQRDETTILIVDEAQTIGRDLLEEIRLLANIETNDVKLLPVILAGQPELATRLNADDLRQLKQRVALRCALRPLTQTETLGYVAGRVRAAGGIGAQVFTLEAVVLIHQRSGGIPRAVSVIADNALLTAFALGKKPVTSDIVQEVCRDLDLLPHEDVLPREAPVPVAAPAAAAVTATPAAAAAVSIIDRSAGALAMEPPPAEPTPHTAPREVEAERPLFGMLWRKRRRFSFF